MIMDRIALVLAIIGGINWGSVGLFRFDLVAWLFGGQTATVSRVIYTIVGIAALWCISLLFRERVSELAMLMCYEVTRDLPLVDAEIASVSAENNKGTLNI